MDNKIEGRDNPLVSVVVSFHNEKILLREAVESVLNQNYTNCELILVDDGSEEASTRIALQYAHNYPDRVRYYDHPYHQRNGVCASRNLGVRMAQGELVAFLDADDVWLPGKVAHQVSLLERYPDVSVVVEASLYWWSWLDERRNDILVKVGVPEGVYRPPTLMHKLYPLAKGDAPCPSGIMVRRAVVRRLLFEEAFRGVFQVYEDQAFLCKLYLEETVYVSDACHNQYRQRPGSQMAALQSSGNYDKIRSFFLYWLKDYLRRLPVRHRAVERLLRRAQMPYRHPLRYHLIVEWPRRLRKAMLTLFIKTGRIRYSKSW